MLTSLGEVQIPLLAVMLLGGCVTKLRRAIADRSIDAALGPTALFPLKMRRSAALALCAVEFGFGIGLIITAGRIGSGGPAELIRLGTSLLFLVATCARIELRSVRPDIGCGCFGEFSSTPITWRTLTRSGLLAVAALASARVRPIKLPKTGTSAAAILLLLAAELVVFGLLSPEIRDVLVRVGYTAPCELRVPPPEQTLAALQRSAAWRRHAALITSQQPTDMWRELCWRYIAFPSRQGDREADLVFAVYLQHYRPTVLSVLVDADSGAVLPWPAGGIRPISAWQRLAAAPWRLASSVWAAAQRNAAQQNTAQQNAVAPVPPGGTRKPAGLSARFDLDS